ncbi:MAG: hypothetical protein KKC46_04340 [Proteobacteria bacterium]|nr:hypothetical protein [Pseudomonadota bacterium]
MKEKIDFGDVGIKIGDLVIFSETGDQFYIGSGKGVLGNGGGLLSYADESYTGLHSIRLITKRYLGGKFDDNIDEYELFTYEGKTLRQIYNDKIQI